MVNYKTNDDTNISCNVKKACRCPPPPQKKKSEMRLSTWPT